MTNKRSLTESLNVAFLRLKPFRKDIDVFKTQLAHVFTHIDETESEEFHKNLLADFFKNSYYSPQHFINTKGRNDLVIHNGKDAKSKVAVIIEAKSPSNKAQMPLPEDLNKRAMQELLLYYLRERVTYKNIELKHLIITNVHEWFIFDAQVFEQHFFHNKDLITQFLEFEEKQLVGKNTEFFYHDIAEPALCLVQDSIEFCYFDLRDYQKFLQNSTPENEAQLIPLFKLFSPEHLLKLPFANDSNSLNKSFYHELLHIVGLAEFPDNGKRIIHRKLKHERDNASLLEHTILQLETLGKVSYLDDVTQYGIEIEEQLFSIALELVITWINRILFLKLLEAQLISYHKNNSDYAFLNLEKIDNFSDLNNLFFQVLSRKPNERHENVREKFAFIPYLNSSLFEPTELEQQCFFISELSGKHTVPLLPIINSTILKEPRGKKLTGELTALEYLLKFLDAYDFGSDNSKAIQENNKPLISASVLGLIFEKINGYKEGSFFTPGFITMYMCRETIRRAVIQKFNAVKGWQCQTLDDVYDKIEDKREANQIINSLKICDPAVGSGHFLVSVLNELLVIKSELKILMDRKKQRRLKEYTLEISNDELYIYDKDDGKLVIYNPINPDKQSLQEALFHEKQTIIENCLFGVDINPNSVKICRLRLWIELLKNAYYIENNDPETQHLPRQLETLPNIDINIKCGNSLISRYPLDVDLKSALMKSNLTIENYKNAVDSYKNAENGAQKQALVKLIATVKNNFCSYIDESEPKYKVFSEKKNQLYALKNQKGLFEIPAGLKKQIADLTKEVQQLSDELAAEKNNPVFDKAFEWRFEFPEVLNNDGDFIGFDVVIGNPPYFSVSHINHLKPVLTNYKTYSSSGDIYALFYELGQNILDKNGFESFIISNKWMRANYGEALREYIVTNSNPLALVDFGQNLIFDNATVHTNIILSQKTENKNELSAVRFEDGVFFEYVKNFNHYIDSHKINNIKVDGGIWNLCNENQHSFLEKIEQHKKLQHWKININFGIKTGFNEAFIINEKTKESLIAKDAKNAEIIKPILRGRDTRRYYCNYANLYVITTFPALSINIEDYPVIEAYLNDFGKSRLEQSGMAGSRKKTPNQWFELQDTIAYYKDFTKPKIIFSEIVSEPQFYYDINDYYPEATVFVISGDHLKYLTALLNSKAVTYFFKSFYMGGELVGKIRYKKAFLEQVPIPEPTESQENEIVKLVDEIIEFKKSGKDTSDLEKQIDQLVYALYDLTPEEQLLIENSK